MNLPLHDGLRRWLKAGPGAALQKLFVLGLAMFWMGLSVQQAEAGVCAWPYCSCEQVVWIEVDPVHPDTVYAGGRCGVSRSEDAGDTWTALPIDEYMGLGFVGALRINPENPKVLYATVNTEQEGGILTTGAKLYRSRNSGATWRKVLETEPYYQFTDIALDVLDAGLLYLSTDFGSGIGGSGQGILKSRDDGKRWRRRSRGLELETVYAVSADPTRPHTLYAGLGGGISISTDAAMTWGPIIPVRHPLDPNLPWAIGRVAVNPHEPDRMIATGLVGLWKSSDAGQSWEHMQDPNLPGSVHYDPVEENTIYFAPRGLYEESFHPYANALIKSTDGGETWNRIVSTEPLINLAGEGSYNNIAFQSSTRVKKKKKGTRVLTVMYVGTNKGLFRSLNNGKTWQDISPVEGFETPIGEGPFRQP